MEIFACFGNHPEQYGANAVTRGAFRTAKEAGSGRSAYFAS